MREGATRRTDGTIKFQISIEENLTPQMASATISLWLAKNLLGIFRANSREMFSVTSFRWGNSDRFVFGVLSAQVVRFRFSFWTSVRDRTNEKSPEFCVLERTLAPSS